MSLEARTYLQNPSEHQRDLQANSSFVGSTVFARGLAAVSMFGVKEVSASSSNLPNSGSDCSGAVEWFPSFPERSLSGLIPAQPHHWPMCTA